MSNGFPTVYRSFEEFERAELRKLDSLRTSIDDLVDESFAEEMFGDDDATPRRRRGRPRKVSY